MTTYAYSRILYDAEVDKPANQAAGQVGTITKQIAIEVGEKVTQAKVGVSDEIWESWYRDQVIGDEPLPKDLGADESLNQYRLRKANAEAALVAAGGAIRSSSTAKEEKEEDTSK